MRTRIALAAALLGAASIVLTGCGGDAAETNVNGSKAPETSEAIKDVNGNDSGLDITKSKDGSVNIDGNISGDTKVDVGDINN